MAKKRLQNIVVRVHKGRFFLLHRKPKQQVIHKISCASPLLSIRETKDSKKIARKMYILTMILFKVTRLFSH